MERNFKFYFNGEFYPVGVADDGTVHMPGAAWECGLFSILEEPQNDSYNYELPAYKVIQDHGIYFLVVLVTEHDYLGDFEYAPEETKPWLVLPLEIDHGAQLLLQHLSNEVGKTSSNSSVPYEVNNHGVRHADDEAVFSFCGLEVKLADFDEHGYGWRIESIAAEH
ncbi:MAG: hypothetical protein IKO41_09030 [Lachnospiraceae bacterium]|nr:hypothetical protein [Lachnospiraceae bacterium]